jgi:glycosyltransferase involved in cell wall biosynthesis
VTHPLGVLFLQSQAFFGADSAVHAQLMRHLDRRAVTVHCACTETEADDPRMTAARRIRQIPDLHVRSTDFGRSVYGRPLSTRVRGGIAALTASAHAVGLIRYMKREQIRIVHGTEKPRDAFGGVWLARLAGAKSVIHMHVGYGDWLSPRVRWALGAADALVGVSRFVAEGLVAAGYPADRVFAVHNSLDLADPTWDRLADRRALRASLGIDALAPVICIASRLFRWKGHHDLVEAVNAIRAELPDVRLLIVGEDDPRANPGGGSYRMQLASRIAELGLERNVVFTGFRTDVADLMAASDVFCQPSAEEPFGMVYLEAMAVRRPVVAYRSGGAPEVVADGETGFLVERGDVTSLATALVRLLRDEALRRRFGDAGRRRVEMVFAPARSAAAMLEVYRAVAAGGRVTAGSTADAAI